MEMFCHLKTLGLSSAKLNVTELFKVRNYLKEDLRANMIIELSDRYESEIRNELREKNLTQPQIKRLHKGVFKMME